MTPFAIVFMSVSMLSVTILTAFCLYRILATGTRTHDDNGEE